MRFSAMPPPSPLFCPFFLSFPRSPSFIRTPSLPLPFHRHPLSSFLLLHRHRSWHGLTAEARSLAHRHFTCVSFARRSRTPLLLLFSFFPTAPLLLFFLDILLHLLTPFRCCHSLFLFLFHENCTPPSLFSTQQPLATSYPLSYPIMTVTG